MLVGVQPQAAPRHPPVTIEHHGPKTVVLVRHQTQQNGPITLATTAHARPLRLARARVAIVREPSCRALGLLQSTSFGRQGRLAQPVAAGAEVVPSLASCSASASEWISIRQPVNLAAKRAFCPSLPMASESW